MFDAIKNEIGDVVRGQISSMPPAEAQGHAQTMLAGLRGDGKEDLAKELEEVMRSAAADPRAAGGALLAFVQHHPDIVQQYAPSLASMIGSTSQSSAPPSA